MQRYQKFKYKNIITRANMPLQELKDYYRMVRKYEFERHIPIARGSRLRKLIHPICLGIVKFDGLLKGRKIHLVSDLHHESDRPLLYVSNHIGRYDVEVCFEAIKKHAYLFIGDPEDLYQKAAGLLLYLNGMIVLETTDKTDRYISKERSVELLQSGNSLLIYPEGAWNLSENQVIMPLYFGAVEMAIRADVEIIPIAIEQRGKDFYVNIGANISYKGKALIDKRKYTDELRDILINLRWDIWSRFDVKKRTSLSGDYRSRYVKDIMDESEFIYKAEDAYKAYYKPKDIVSPQEAFDFMEQMIPKKENAFLFREK